MKPETKETEQNYYKLQEFRDKSSSRLDLAAEALSNHLVLKKIFLYLDTKDLLQLSLVNKFWCSTARPVLRNFKKCLAINTGSNPCHELIELNQVLITSQNHPYSGLAIRILQHEKMHKCSAKEARMSVDDQDHNSFAHASTSNQHNLTTLAYPMVLDKIKFRHLEICWDNDYDCPAQKLLRKILKERMEEFEEIKIIQFPDSIMRRGPLKNYLHAETVSLPKLKILDFLSSRKFSMLWRTYNERHWLRSMKYELVRAAPRLEKLIGMNSLADLKFFLENKKAHVLTEYLVTPKDLFDVEREDQLGEIMKFGLCQPKLTKFSLDGYYLDCDPNSAGYIVLTDFLRRMLESSSSSLEVIELTQSHLIKIIPDTTVQPLRALTKLRLGLITHIDKRLGLFTLERFNWDKIFPALHSIEFELADICDDTLMDNEGQCIENALRETLLQRLDCSPCKSVQTISFVEQADYSVLGYLGRLFPNVTECSFLVRACTTLEDTLEELVEETLEFLWITWPNLEIISMSLRAATTSARENAMVETLAEKLHGSLVEEAGTCRSIFPDTMRSKGFSTAVAFILSFRRLKKLRIEILDGINRGDRKSAFPSTPAGFEMEVEVVRTPVTTCGHYLCR